ncbi:hypothetical protein SEA_YDN12_9 [Streptomyces phage YDN12]|uniref:Uncharacterized protein n=1 Tax=Streptomyces phage YDN12 TaxID=1636183 RepID=A0A0E3JJC1_9CAUD|nr:hypothetical protein AVT63_gp09 [Streptomyces phage YDN12]AKA61676.1 hypothetical protein SEA_YDN12_9 [Streptomyces phage YDN12]
MTLRVWQKRRSHRCRSGRCGSEFPTFRIDTVFRHGTHTVTHRTRARTCSSAVPA